MLALYHSEHLEKFHNVILIKGYSKMFTLSRRINGSCLWHLTSSSGGSPISYASITGAGDFAETSLHEIIHDRHFVEFCRSSSYGAGIMTASLAIL